MLSRRTVVALCLSVGTVAALAVHPGDAAAQLTPEEAAALITCQDAVAKAGQKFVKTKLKLVEQCGTEIAEVILKCDAGDPKCDSLGEKAAAKCESNFAKVAPASTKFVDAVIEACAPVEALLFGGTDPLAYQALIGLIEDLVGEDLNITDVEALAGALCVGKELLVDLTAVLEVPLLFEAPFFAIPLDDRCVLGFEPV
jgi:hypothetical protein